MFLRHVLPPNIFFSLSISFDNIIIYKMRRELCKQIVYAIDEKKSKNTKIHSLQLRLFHNTVPNTHEMFKYL